MKTKNLIYILLAAGLIALVVYRYNKNSAADAQGGKGAKPVAGKPGAQPPATVQAVVLKPQVFSEEIDISGTIEANEEIQLHTEVPGIAQKIYFEEGAQVAKGQLLVKISDAELRAQLSQAMSKQNLASENENRARQLLQKEAISKEEYDMSRADLQSTQAQTRLIQAQLAKTNIRAPFSGIIGLRAISEGSFITPETAIASLADLEPVKVKFSVPEKYVGQITVNSTIQFTVAGSSRLYEGKIYAIEPGLDVESRTLTMRATAPNPYKLLKPGQFANIKLRLQQLNNALLVPTQALIPVQSGKKVYVAKNGKATEVMVQTAARTQTHVVVTSGLKAGDTVLTTGIMSLKNGASIKYKKVNLQP